MGSPPPILAYVTAVLTIVFWASSYVAIRMGVIGLSPGALGLLRYSIAAVIMFFVYLSVKKKSRINLKDGLLIFLTGGLGIGLYNVCLNEGEITVNASVTAFVIAMMPVLAAIIARFLFNERLKWIGYIGFLISVSGVVIICISESNGQLAFTVGILFVLLSVVCGCFYSMMSKMLLQKYGAIELAALCIMSAGIVQLVFLPELLHELPHAGAKTIGAAIYLGIFPAAISYLCFSYTLKFFPVVKVTSSLYALPFITTFLAWLVLSEVPTVWSFVGGIIAVIGPILISRFGVKK